MTKQTHFNFPVDKNKYMLDKHNRFMLGFYSLIIKDELGTYIFTISPFVLLLLF